MSSNTNKSVFKSIKNHSSQRGSGSVFLIFVLFFGMAGFFSAKLFREYRVESEVKQAIQHEAISFASRACAAARELESGTPKNILGVKECVDKNSAKVHLMFDKFDDDMIPFISSGLIPRRLRR